MVSEQVTFILIVCMNINQIWQHNDTNALFNERIKLNASQMHDVRNQVYSLNYQVSNLCEGINNIKEDISNNERNNNSQTIDQIINVKFEDEKKFSNDEKFKNRLNIFSENIEDANYKLYQEKSKEIFNQNMSKSKMVIDKLKSNAEKNVGYTIKILDKHNENNKIKHPSNLNELKKRRQDLKRNLKKIDKTNQIIDLNISFDNISIFDEDDQEQNQSDLQENNLELKNQNVDFKSDKQSVSSMSNINIENENSSKNQYFNKELQNLMNKIDNPIEMLNIIKFIKYKICFLQHTELTFEINQKIKQIISNPPEILNQISKNMKILFINKYNDITLKVESKTDQIILDIFMLKYLICQMASYLHNFNSNINIHLVFEKSDNKFNLCIKTTGININAFKSQKLNENHLLEKIIQNLGYNTEYEQNYDTLLNYHTILISYEASYNLIPHSEPDQQFCETNKIKDDVIFSNQFESVFVFEQQKISLTNNYIFINIDDEANIKSMHTLLFTKENIPLICCSTANELKALFVQIYTQSNPSADEQPRIVVLLDHMLDGTQGIDLQRELKLTQVRFGLDVWWVVVSSTEDMETMDMQRAENVEKFLSKPLTVNKIHNLLDYVGQKKNSE